MPVRPLCLQACIKNLKGKEPGWMSFTFDRFQNKEAFPFRLFRSVACSDVGVKGWPGDLPVCADGVDYARGGLNPSTSTKPFETSDAAADANSLS